jgi:hypothetical protein
VRLISSFPSKNIRTENCQLNFELHLFLKEKVRHKCTPCLQRETRRKFYKSMENIFEGTLMTKDKTCNFLRFCFVSLSRTSGWKWLISSVFQSNNSMRDSVIVNPIAQCWSKCVLTLVCHCSPHHVHKNSILVDILNYLTFSFFLFIWCFFNSFISNQNYWDSIS